MPRLKFFGFVIVTAAFLLMLLLFLSFNQQSLFIYHKVHLYSNLILEEYVTLDDSNGSLVKEIRRQQQLFIEDETSDYPFTPNTKLSNFTLSTEGKPVRSIIITTWRSGSTFFGDILNKAPGNYYHYEPLLHYGIVQIRPNSPTADSAVEDLKRMLNCDYKNLDNYLKSLKNNIYFVIRNMRLWGMCDIYPNYCWNPTFLSEFCKLFPFQSMKLVRLRLQLAEELLKDESLNVRVLLLVRDPRGTLQSRKHREWCPGTPDCDQANLLCADMVSDYSAAIKLKKLYPSRFRAIRYEDLSMDPYKSVQEIFKFFGLYFHPQVKSFLDSHTKANSGGVSSTFRNTKKAPFHWRSDLNFSEVQYIEENCDQAMKLWGYVKAYNESHLREFHPVTLYTIDDSKN